MPSGVDFRSSARRWAWTGRWWGTEVGVGSRKGSSAEAVFDVDGRRQEISPCVGRENSDVTS